MRLPLSLALALIGAWLSYVDVSAAVSCEVSAEAVVHIVPDDTLNTATVTDERKPQASAPGPSSRLSRDRIEKSGMATLQEAMKTFAGVSIRDYGGIGGLKTVNIRNFGAQHTGLSYDGVILTDAMNGQVDIGLFDLEAVSGITVKIAGNDDIYRSARLNSSVGTVEITTLRPQSGTSADVRLRVASFGTYEPYIRVNQGFAQRWNASVSASGLISDGDYPFILHNGNVTTHEVRLNSDVKSFKSELNVHGEMGKAGNLDVKIAGSMSERGLPGSVILYTQHPSERLWDKSLMCSLIHDVSFRIPLKLKTSLSHNYDWNRYLNDSQSLPEPQDDRYRQRNTTISAVLLWSPLPHLSASIAEDLVISTLSANIPGCLYPVRETSYTALSLKYSSRRLNAVASLLGTIVREQTRKGSPAPGREHLSPSLGASFSIVPGLRARASFKESYRLPTFNDIYYPRMGNKDLEPEKAIQFNIGLVYDRLFDSRPGNWSVTASIDAYHNRVRDKIAAIPSMFIWSMRNLGKVDMWGCDVSFSARGPVAEWLRFRIDATWSWQRAVDVTDRDSKYYKHQIAYTPRHSGYFSTIFETRWLNIGYSVQAVGTRYSLSQNTRAYKIEPYADHVLSLNRTFVFGRRHSWRLAASAEALNLAGKNYEIMKYYPMPGRNWRITLKISY
ncbi:MAG: TonB-dependent receptor plug domain-containing protein [Candidatus Cryptobacteroides sp.]